MTFKIQSISSKHYLRRLKCQWLGLLENDFRRSGTLTIEGDVVEYVEILFLYTRQKLSTA